MAEGRVSDANYITEKYMDSILVEQRLIDTVEADLSTTFLGENFSMPIMTPAFSHLKAYHGRELTGLEEYSIAAKNLNILNFVGMMENDMFQKIAQTGAKTVRIVKPYEDDGKVRDQILFAKETGAFAVGIDIDHIFGEDGYDVVIGERMTCQSTEKLAGYAALTDLPFIIKGVLSVQDALKCAQIGVKAIIVSHHHGRLPYAVPPMLALPQIKEALEGTGIQIIVDCSIATGADVYKALALGADAAAPGRAMMPSLEKDGIAGAEEYYRKVGKELAFMMGMTGFCKVDEIDDSALWLPRTYTCFADQGSRP